MLDFSEFQVSGAMIENACRASLVGILFCMTQAAAHESSMKWLESC